MADEDNAAHTESSAAGAVQGTSEESQTQSQRRPWALGSVPGINRLASSGPSLQDMVHRLIPPELQGNYRVIPPGGVNLAQSQRQRGAYHHGHSHQHLYQHSRADGHTHSHLASAALMPVSTASPSSPPYPLIAGIPPSNTAVSSVMLNMFDEGAANVNVNQTESENSTIPRGTPVPNATPPSNEGAVNNNNLGHGHGHAHGNARLANQGNTIQLRNLSLQGCVPFILLLCAKLFFDHLGILILLAMCGTLMYADKVLVNYVAHRDNAKQLLAVVLLLSSSIALLYYCFREDKLYRSLYLSLPEVTRMDMWTLFWIVAVTDFVVRFSVIILKAFVAVASKYLLKHKKKQGKYLSLLEYISQLYASVLPITPWVSYLLDDNHGISWVSMIFISFYTLCKAQHLFVQAKVFRKALINFRKDQRFGTYATKEDIAAASNCCAICQDHFTDPIKLVCKHVFCEDCISVWFVREKTCPMCRAEVVNTDGMLWRDGSTMPRLQFY